MSLCQLLSQANLKVRARRRCRNPKATEALEERPAGRGVTLHPDEPQMKYPLLNPTDVFFVWNYVKIDGHTGGGPEARLQKRPAGLPSLHRRCVLTLLLDMECESSFKGRGKRSSFPLSKPGTTTTPRLSPPSSSRSPAGSWSRRPWTPGARALSLVVYQLWDHLRGPWRGPMRSRGCWKVDLRSVDLVIINQRYSE